MIRLIPNILTIGRGVLTLAFLGLVLYSPHSPDKSRFSMLLDVGFVLFVIAGLTDIIDGAVARKLNVTSKFGRMIDPLVDKLLVCGAFVSFAIIGQPKLFNLSQMQLAFVHWSVAAILLGREAYVTTLRHIAEARGVNFAATPSGKIKMFLQSFAIGTVIIKMAHVPTASWGHWFTTVTFAVMLTATIYSGLVATRRESWKQARNLPISKGV